MTATKRAPAKKTAPKAVTNGASKPKPKPKPGDKNFDWKAEYPGEEVFVYSTIDGKKTVGLAALGPKRKFKPGEIRRSLHLSEMQQLFMLVERIASSNALTVSDEFDDVEYRAMMDAWSEWSNTSTGES